jgi:hypothetical protein
MVARPPRASFANVTPETHGDRQKVFDRIVERLTRLEDRVEKEGQEDAGR